MTKSIKLYIFKTFYLNNTLGTITDSSSDMIGSYLRLLLSEYGKPEEIKSLHALIPPNMIHKQTKIYEGLVKVNPRARVITSIKRPLTNTSIDYITLRIKL